MSQLSDIIQSLQDNSSTLAKQAILEKNKSNTNLEALFLATLDPMINYYLRGNSLIMSDSGTSELTKDTIRSVVETLNKRVVTGHAARDWVQSVCDQLVPEDQELLRRMLNHDLECKVSEGIVNRVWKNLIKSYPVLLATKPTPKNLKKFEEAEQFIVQTKEDGGRCNAVIRDGDVTFYSRNGNELLMHGVMNGLLQSFDNHMIDGELVQYVGDNMQDRKTSNGFFNKAVRKTITKEEAETFVFVVWDMIPIDKFDNRKDETPYSKRFENLQNVLNTINSDKIRIVDTEFVSSLDEATIFYKKQRAKKLEGAIYKTFDLCWEDDRSDNMVKVKEVRTCELRCVGVKPHNKKVGQIGSLDLETEDGLLFTNSGSGLTDEDREKSPNYFIGKIIEIEYNEIIKSKTNKKPALFLPVVKTIRLDKDKANTLEELNDE
jgi:DNA ligase-1